MADRKAKKRRRQENEQEIVFDPKARFKYITGFRKRKLARRKKAYMEDLEAERKDNIDVRREHREEVKQRWKELKNAEKRIDKILAMKDVQRRIKAITDRNPEYIDEEGALGMLADQDVPVVQPQNLKMITFEQEDDDPFGGCEVTTSVPGGFSLPGAEQEKILALTDGTQERENEGDEDALMMLPPEDPEERAKRREANIKKAESVRKRALAKRARKLIELKDKQKRSRGKKKRKKGKKGKGGQKAGAKARRKRK